MAHPRGDMRGRWRQHAGEHGMIFALFLVCTNVHYKGVHTMKRILLTLLCLGVLGTVTGCYVDPAPYGVSSVDIGVGAYQEEVPYWSTYPEWRYRYGDRWYYRHYPYEWWR